MIIVQTMHAGSPIRSRLLENVTFLSLKLLKGQQVKPRYVKLHSENSAPEPNTFFCDRFK